jgi:hypothetical protein
MASTSIQASAPQRAPAAIANPELSASISIGELFIWLAAILFASAATRRIVDGEDFIELNLIELSRINIFQVMGWFAVFRLLGLQRAAAQACKADYYLAAAVGLLSLLPAKEAGWLAASVAAAYIYFRAEKGSYGRAAASVLAALCVQGFWGPIFLSLFSYDLLRADAALVGVALDLTQTGYHWHDNVIQTQGHEIEIYVGCSSFHNVSLAALGWVTLTNLARPEFSKFDYLFGIGGCVTMIFSNAVRIYMMSLSPELMLYWHDGFGAQIVAVSSSAIIATICVLGVSFGAPLRE